jgi:succinyl-CoA synthetase alpha subunit
VYSFSTTKHPTTIMAIVSHLLESELIMIIGKLGPNRKYQKPEVIKILPVIAFIANFGIP